MSGAEKYALVQGQTLLWAGVALVTYLLATEVSLALAMVFAVPLVAMMIWAVARRS